MVYVVFWAPTPLQSREVDGACRRPDEGSMEATHLQSTYLKYGFYIEPIIP